LVTTIENFKINEVKYQNDECFPFQLLGECPELIKKGWSYLKFEKSSSWENKRTMFVDFF